MAFKPFFLHISSTSNEFPHITSDDSSPHRHDAEKPRLLQTDRDMKLGQESDKLVLDAILPWAKEALRIAELTQTVRTAE